MKYSRSSYPWALGSNNTSGRPKRGAPKAQVPKGEGQYEEEEEEEEEDEGQEEDEDEDEETERKSPDRKVWSRALKYLVIMSRRPE